MHQTSLTTKTLDNNPPVSSNVGTSLPLSNHVSKLKLHFQITRQTAKLLEECLIYN